jgi:hypothetical protein
MLALRGHPAGAVLALGPSSYAAYMLVQYVVGPQYQAYQASIAWHLALLILSVALLITAWASVDARQLAPRSRGWAIVVFLLAGFVVSRWLPAFTGMAVSDPVPAATPDVTMYWSIFMLDLGFVVPAAVATGVGLLIGTAWARTALHGVIGWFALVPPSVAAMAIVKVVGGDPNAAVGDTVVFIVVSVIFWVVAVWLYRPLLVKGRGSSTDARSWPIHRPAMET